MRAESAVEPTRSENITVTRRRSAASQGDASIVAGVATVLAGTFWVSRSAMARISWRRWPSRTPISSRS